MSCGSSVRCSSRRLRGHGAGMNRLHQTPCDDLASKTRLAHPAERACSWPTGAKLYSSLTPFSCTHICEWPCGGPRTSLILPARKRSAEPRSLCFGRVAVPCARSQSFYGHSSRHQAHITAGYAPNVIGQLHLYAYKHQPTEYARKGPWVLGLRAAPALQHPTESAVRSGPALDMHQQALLGCMQTCG